MKNIVIIDHEPFTIRRKDIFYIDQLRERGFDIQFWDCSQYFHPGMVIADTLQETHVRSFDSLKQIEAALDSTDIQNTIFIVEAFEIWRNRKFFRLLAQHGCYMIRQEMYASATLEDISLWAKLWEASLLKIIKALRNRILAFGYKLYCKKYKISYSLKISSGNSSDINVHINHPDWENSKKLIAGSRLIDQPYILFLDELFTLHPDMHFFVNEKVGNTESYHRILNRFFDKLEKKYSMPVVIAAHPKSGYVPETFAGRRIIKYKSIELVRDSQMVFMHSTAAISYIMILDKPIALTVTDDYTKIFDMYTNVKKIHNMTLLPIYNIESEPDNVEFRHIEPQIRHNYIYSYMTSPGIEQRSNIDILSETFSRL